MKISAAFCHHYNCLLLHEIYRGHTVTCKLIYKEHAWKLCNIKSFSEKMMDRLLERDVYLY